MTRNFATRDFSLYTAVIKEELGLIPFHSLRIVLLITLLTAQSLAQTIPAPSMNRLERYGGYHWTDGTKGVLKPGDVDNVNWGASKLAETNTKVIRVPLSNEQSRNVHTHDTVWFEDDAPPFNLSTYGGDSWTYVTNNPVPYFGAKAHKSDFGAGLHQHYFYGATGDSTFKVNTGDRLFVYVYLHVVPQEIMLQWHVNGDPDSGWGHRAYWGTNLIPWGVDNTEQRRRIGDVPTQTGKWIRLEIPASRVGLDGKVLDGMAFTLYGGQVSWDRAGASKNEFVWIDDVFAINNTNPGYSSGEYLYNGTILSTGWNNVTDTSATTWKPLSGGSAHQSSIYAGGHQLFVQNVDPANKMFVNSGDILFAWVYLDPNNPPTSIALQWQVKSSDVPPGGTDYIDNGEWRYRAYWGADMFSGLVTCDSANYVLKSASNTYSLTSTNCDVPSGQTSCQITPGNPNCSYAKNPSSTSGCAKKRNKGPLPDTGKWVRLEVAAEEVGLVGHLVSGVALTMQDGRAVWDRVGKQTTETVWVDDTIPAGSSTFSESEPATWTWKTRGTIPRNPVSGIQAHETPYYGGFHQHSFYNATDPLKVNVGDVLFAWVYLDPGTGPYDLSGPPPTDRATAVTLAWQDDLGWAHRAYWANGTNGNAIPYGVEGSDSKRKMGELPAVGKWVRLEVPAWLVGLEGKTVRGMQFGLVNGRAYWDRAGKTIDLAQMAASPGYFDFFNNPNFNTYMLSAYSSGALGNNFLDGFSDAEFQAERMELKRLGDYILTANRYSNFANKKFIILEWEGGHVQWYPWYRAEGSGSASNQSLRDPSDFLYNNFKMPLATGTTPCDKDVYAHRWDDNRLFYQARANGVNDSRVTNPSQAARYYFGLEFWNANTFYVWNRPAQNNLPNYNPNTGAPNNSAELVFNDYSADTRPYVPCGTKSEDPLRPEKYSCLSSKVLHRIGESAGNTKPDYYSYSAWETINLKYGQPSADLKGIFKDVLRDKDLSGSYCNQSLMSPADFQQCQFAHKSVLKKIQTGNGNGSVDQTRFIIGEWGYEFFPVSQNTNMLSYMTETQNAFDFVTDSTALKPSFVVYWQSLGVNPLVGLSNGSFEPTNPSLFYANIQTRQVTKNPNFCAFYNFVNDTTSCPSSFADTQLLQQQQLGEISSTDPSSPRDIRRPVESVVLRQIPK